MKSISLTIAFALALVIGGMLAMPGIAAHGDKDWDKDWEKGEKWGKGKGKGHRDDKWEKGDKGWKGERYGHFDERRVVVVREYYAEQYRAGRCPPGLKKKHNGCMPPGQAKKWKYGRPLPPDVVYYPVPQPVIAQIGPPPAGYRYVRVASDILMIAIGSGMVVDAIEDLGRMR